jgi:hypothetical protein
VGDPSDDHFLEYVFAAWPYPDLVSYHWLVNQVNSGPAMRIAFDRVIDLTHYAGGSAWTVPAAFSAGDEIGPGLDYREFTMTLLYRSDETLEVPYAVWVPEHSFLALEFELPSGETHYGWLELLAEHTTEGQVGRFVAIRWGYNDAPGTAAPIPHFGTGDCDGDGAVGAGDVITIGDCLAGPDGGLGMSCTCVDHDSDGDVDMADFSAFQEAFSSEASAH